MPALTTGLTEEIRRDFVRGCFALDEARRRLAVRDSPDHRDAVVDCREQIDAVLDMYLAFPAGRSGG
jgi:hypothetical protein